MKKIYPSILTIAMIASLGVAYNVDAAQNQGQGNNKNDNSQQQFTGDRGNGQMGTSTKDMQRPNGPMGSTSPKMNGEGRDDNMPRMQASSTSSTTTSLLGKVGHFFKNLFGGDDTQNQNQNQNQNQEKNQERNEEGMLNRNNNIIGTITEIDGTTLTISGKVGTSTEAQDITVDASNAVVKKDQATSTVSDLAVDDVILVQGKFDGSTIVATVIRVGNFNQEQNFEINSDASTTPKQTNPGFFKRIGNFFSNLF